MTTARPRPIGTVTTAMISVFTIERQSSSSWNWAVKFSKPTQLRSLRPSQLAKASTRLAAKGSTTKTVMPMSCGPMKR